MRNFSSRSRYSFFIFLCNFLMARPTQSASVRNHTYLFSTFCRYYTSQLVLTILLLCISVRYVSVLSISIQNYSVLSMTSNCNWIKSLHGLDVSQGKTMTLKGVWFLPQQTSNNIGVQHPRTFESNIVTFLFVRWGEKR